MLQRTMLFIFLKQKKVENEDTTKRGEEIFSQLSKEHALQMQEVRT